MLGHAHCFDVYISLPLILHRLGIAPLFLSSFLLLSKFESLRCTLLQLWHRWHLTQSAREIARLYFFLDVNRLTVRLALTRSMRSEERVEGNIGIYNVMNRF